MGDYVDNKKCGQGTFCYPDGSRYEGIITAVLKLLYWYNIDWEMFRD